MCRRLMYVALVSAFCLISTARAQVVWDFENGNDHGFTLKSIKPATPAPDDPNTAGNEAITGGWAVGDPNNLPEAGVVWTIGKPTMMDGLLPGADPDHARLANGVLDYASGTNRMSADHGFLNTYNLNYHGDQVHTQANDQIATSPMVLLYEGAMLTATVAGGGGQAPILDADPNLGYTDGSCGIAVISADDGTLLVSMATPGKGGEDPFTLDLSAFAGQKVYIEVVDAYAGGWGWIAVDEIQITNARALRAAVMIVSNTGLTLGFDQAQKDRLEMLGYDVTLATGNDVKNDVFTRADAETFDVLVASESIGSGDINKLIGVNVPMMHQESYGWSRHFFTAGLKKAWTTPVNGMLDVVNDTHPITLAAGLAAGPVPFFTDPNVALTTDLVASLIPGAVNLAQTKDVDGNDVTCIFAIEAGTELANASPAANRIVGFSLPGNNTYAAGAMTGEAWALFDASINWLDPD